jgi:hypothetical protein
VAYPAAVIPRGAVIRRLTFVTSKTSKKIYMNRRHKELAHAYRVKLKSAGVRV